MLLILATDLEYTFPAIKKAVFMAGDLKNSFQSTKSPNFMDRTTFPHPMSDLLSMGRKWSY